MRGGGKIQNFQRDASRSTLQQPTMIFNLIGVLGYYCMGTCPNQQRGWSSWLGRSLLTQRSRVQPPDCVPSFFVPCCASALKCWAKRPNAMFLLRLLLINTTSSRCRFFTELSTQTKKENECWMSTVPFRVRNGLSHESSRATAPCENAQV